MTKEYSLYEAARQCGISMSILSVAVARGLLDCRCALGRRNTPQWYVTLPAVQEFLARENLSRAVTWVAPRRARPAEEIFPLPLPAISRAENIRRERELERSLKDPWEE